MKGLFAGLLLGSLAATSAYADVMIDVRNDTTEDCSLAINARADKTKWITQGWYVFASGEEAPIILKGINDIHNVYIYNDCQKNVNRFLCVGQIPGIRDNAGDAGEETILSRDLPDRRDRFHRLIRRCPGVIRDRHERRVSADERIPHILREHLDRHIERCEAVIPDHVMHMGDFPDLCFQL